MLDLEWKSQLPKYKAAIGINWPAASGSYLLKLKEQIGHLERWANYKSIKSGDNFKAEMTAQKNPFKWIDKKRILLCWLENTLAMQRSARLKHPIKLLKLLINLVGQSYSKRTTYKIKQWRCKSVVYFKHVIQWRPENSDPFILELDIK